MATTAQLIDILACDKVNSNGDPLNGYKVRTFASDGTTPASVWEERAKSTAKSEFSLDATGYAEVYGDNTYIIHLWPSTGDPDVDSPYLAIGPVNYTTMQEGNVTGDVTGDILATDSTKILDNGTDGTDATFLGAVTGNSTTSSTTTGYGNTANATNVGSGYQVLNGLTSGTNNSALGYQTLKATTSGGSNTALGIQALYLNQTGSQNVAIGAGSGGAAVAQSRNTAIGYQALGGNSLTGDNVAIGYNAMFNLSSGAGTNVAIGLESLLGANSGSSNSGCGAGSLKAVTTGTTNSGMGMNAGSTLTTGSNSSFLGYNAQPSAVGVSNEVTLGNTSVATLRSQVALTVLSDARDKKNITDIPVGLDFIKDIRPVLFDWNRRDGSKEGLSEAGFIAQEIDAVQDKYGMANHLNLIYKSNPDKLEMTKENLLPVLVKAIQELEARPCGICSYCVYYFKGARGRLARLVKKITNTKLWPR